MDKNIVDIDPVFMGPERYMDPAPTETYEQVKKKLTIAMESLQEIAENPVGYQAVETLQRQAGEALTRISHV